MMDFSKPFQTPLESFPFSTINVENLKENLEKELINAKNKLEKLRKLPGSPSFEEIILGLEHCADPLWRASGVLSNLNHANTNKDLQNLAQEFNPKTSEFINEIFQDSEIFKKVESVYNMRDSISLEKEDLRNLEETYKAFVKNGVGLPESEKKRLKEIDQKLSKLSLSFNQKLLSSTNSYYLNIENEQDVKGLPEISISAAKELAESKGDKGFGFSLQYPSFSAYMKFGPSEKYRKEIYMAFGTRAKSGDDDNRPGVLEIVNLRKERANILGYKTHAEYVLADNMANSPKKVWSFQEELLSSALKKAKEEMRELESFAGIKVNPWDVSFYREKLRKERLDFDFEKLRPYFELSNVTNGIFRIIEKLYDLSFEKRSDIDLYHPDVQVFEVKEKGVHKGILYLDFFPRDSKSGGAWMTTFQAQGTFFGSIKRPHVSTVYNFTKPTKNKPSLLNFGEVRTLFHELGHALHSLLSNCKYTSLAGTSVKRDFVELPSQIFENWATEKEVLEIIAKHYKTGETIPESFIERIKENETFFSGYDCVRQLSFGFLDMHWHDKFDGQETDVEAFEKKAMEQTRLLDPVEGTCMSTAFGHLFAGGYSAGYYGYKWAEVLDADAFSFFKENGIFDKKTAESFKENILSKGNSEDPNILYQKFRGRDPKFDAFYERSGFI